MKFWEWTRAVLLMMFVRRIGSCP
ncbi:hypothetical protein LINPERPRIM_LOCUS261 [Linum perenne]